MTNALAPILPRNVRRFAALLYASLGLDAVSVAFQDHSPSGSISEFGRFAEAIVTGALILVFVYFVWLAVHRRKSWPRWVLLAGLILSIVSLFISLGENGLQIESAIELVSCALTAAGLHASFTGDARTYFDG